MVVHESTFASKEKVTLKQFLRSICGSSASPSYPKDHGLLFLVNERDNIVGVSLIDIVRIHSVGYLSTFP